jgi:hypothetical protein
MRNLLEEIQRMRSLMVYEKGEILNEVGTSSVANIPKNTPEETSTDSEKPAETSSNTGKPEDIEQHCIYVTNTEPYETDNDTNTKVPTAFRDKFIEKLQNEFGAIENGYLEIQEIIVFGGASNFYGGGVQPDYCNEYDVTKGTSSLQKWGTSCKGYDAKKKYTNSGGSTSNRDLAWRRADKVKKKTAELLMQYADTVKPPVKYDKTKIEGQLKDKNNITSGSVYTKDLTDTHKSVSKEIKAGTLNHGQFVMIDAKVCFKSYDPCPKCMIRDVNSKKCRCKDGLTEKDGKCYCPNGREVDENCECNTCTDPCMTFNKETKKCECPEGMTYNEETKECECPPDKIKEGCECKTNEPCPDPCMTYNKEKKKCECPEGMTYNEETKECECPKGFTKKDNCECEKDTPKECPKCMKLDETGECKCNEGLIYNEKTKECDCPEGKIKPTADACNCVPPKPPLKCNYEAKKEGARGTKQNNFVAATVKSSFPAGAGDALTITFDSLVVPDAFYVKYGDQEFFSGFMGDVYNAEYRQVALSIPERKKMLPIQSKSTKEIVKTELSSGDNDYSGMENIVRNFVGELIIYKREDGLLESINAAIKSEGGKLNVKDIFKNGDSEAEKITDDIINSGSIKDNINRYKPIMKSGSSFKITKETENLEIVILVFSPLDRTIFNIQVKCE